LEYLLCLFSFTTEKQLYALGRNKRKYKFTVYSKNGDKINHRYKKM